MGRYSDIDQSRIDRALIVDEFGSVSWDKYLRRTSRGDDGRDPAAD
jgi:hypothetical protein